MKTPMRQVLCDFQMPTFLPEIRIDYADMFRNLKRIEAQSLVFVAKSAHGNSLYPTKVGVPNPAMKEDIFGEISRRCLNAGIQLYAYFNITLDYELAKTKPEWRQCRLDGTPETFERYPMFCMGNDGYMEFVARHMEEIANNYPIDGFFLDLSYFTHQTCFCASCREKFEKQFGYPLNEDALRSIRGALAFSDFKVALREACLVNAMERCNTVRPDLVWLWNHGGDPAFKARRLDQKATYLSSETRTGNYAEADMVARRAACAGKPVVFTVAETQGDWGDWTLTSPAALKGLAGIAIAHGCALMVNQTPYPCGDYGGKTAAPVWDLFAETFQWVKRRERFCVGKEPVFSVGCPVSESSIRLLEGLSVDRTPEPWDGFRRWDYSHNDQFMTQLFAEMQTPLHFFPEAETEQWLHRFECIVLPDCPYVSPQFAEQLRAYVRGGGKLIATYETSLRDSMGALLPNFGLADLFGADFVRKSPFTVSYLDRLPKRLFAHVIRMPLLIMDKSRGFYQANPNNGVFQCSLRRGAKALGHISDPIIESDFTRGHHIYHQHAPAGVRTEVPGLIVNQYGKGKVVYLPMPFFLAFGSTKCPHLKEVFRVLVQDVLEVSQRIRITAPTTIRTVVTNDADSWLLHVLHMPKELDSVYLEQFPCRDRIAVELRPGWNVGAVADCLTGDAIEFKQKSGVLAFRISEVTNYSIFRIEKAL